MCLKRFSKSGATDLFLKKKMARESLKNTRALMVERKYGSYKFFFFIFWGGPNKLILFINNI